mmetsp:Transcript_3869/g.8138  ORF Transcript_3869/g.8138 Transcript_3869/m.8138 type:complete len:97 (-) Transcript_3869:198-488(-)
MVTGVPHPLTGQVQLFSVYLRIQLWQNEWAHASSVAGSAIRLSHSWHTKHDRMASSASACLLVILDGDDDVRDIINDRLPTAKAKVVNGVVVVHER